MRLSRRVLPSLRARLAFQTCRPLLHINFIKPYSTLPTIPKSDESQTIEYYFELQNTFKNDSMSPKIKAKRLKLILIQLIESLPNGEFPHKQLPFINNIINYIDQNPSPLDSFTTNEMLMMLNSVLGAMTLTDVRYIDFFPRFYNALRETDDYQNNEMIRLQLFEIFINYVLLSTNRENVIKVINAFIKEEHDLHQNDKVSLNVVQILLESFRSITPDTATMVLLINIVPDLSDETISKNLLSSFFKAADEEISESFEDNSVSERLGEFINTMEQKLENPFDSYVEILYFATKNNFDDVCQQLLGKLGKLTLNFTNEQYKELLQNDVLFSLVSSSLKFANLQYADNLIKVLYERNESEYVEYEWMSLIQYEAFKLSVSSPAIDLIKKFNDRLLKLDKEYEFADTDSYNLVLESLCWSKKSYKYIEKFRTDFQDEFNVPIDAKSVAQVLNYLCSNNANPAHVEVAANYFMKFKDSVDWENDYEGIYMITLFNLVANVWKIPNMEWSQKLEIYSNVKRYEYLFNKESIYEMLKAAIDQDEGVFAIKVLLDQIPELKKDQPKLPVAKYNKIFDTVYDYLTTKSNDNELNKRVYKYLSDYFQIPYEYYPYFVKMFIDNNDPQMALTVFANMKKLSKELKLPPPNEEFYIYLLKSFSKFKDEDAIFKLHLAIKMDLSLNLDIKLLNSLMEAYAALDDPFKTRDVFNLSFSLPKEIGTNNESAYWMLKSLKYATLDHVNDFYNNLSTYEIIPDANLFAELLIANCYFEQYRTAFERLVLAEENGDYHLINAYVLKTLHNNCLHDGVRNELKTYCMEKFPVQWEELVKSGQLEDNKVDYPDLLANPYDAPHIDVKLISNK